jgi:hypothetical protein
MTDLFDMGGLRALAESAMPDRCEIRRGVGRGSYDPATNKVEPDPGELIYRGSCRFAAGVSATPHSVNVGGLREVLGRFTLHLPHDSPEVRVDDHVRVTESADPQLMIRPLRVALVQMSSVHTHRRVVVEDPQLQGQAEE